ncbi:mRNA export factor [Willisornis vidua]|uniref:Rae1 protein homolog n=1 Tax=Willisornis vidua TaxID=1566151 RepID=A0ABQ9DDI2_9PASS|nr:mRNA export factor [Willisornis vidua]
MFGSTTADNHNPMKDIEVTSPPDDSISCLAFSPPTLPGNFLIAGSWANDGEIPGGNSWEGRQMWACFLTVVFDLLAGGLQQAASAQLRVQGSVQDSMVRCWEVQDNGQTIPKAQQMHTGPVLDACWSDDGSKVFTASCDKTAKMWDLNSNQAIQIAQVHPMAAVATAERGLIVYQLENQPSEFRRIESPLKHQHRCVAIFKDKVNKPTGFALGSIEGRVAIHYINPPNPAKDNFTFKCHRSNGTNTSAPQDIYAVNGIAFHPVHGTLATVGSDGRFSFWDKDARTKLKTSEQLDQPISACCFNHNGNIFAYASSYDWSKGHEFYNPQKKNYIFLRNAAEELKPRNKK